jgi:predicted enzyme related to lactoylglutathione lyase
MPKPEEVDENAKRGPVGRLGMILVSAADPERIAAFWAVVLGVAVEDRLGDPPQYVTLGRTEPGAPRISFERVPEPKIVKNRLHFDLTVADLDQACRRVEALGGHRCDDHDFHEHGYSWRRMADPDGNEFCLVLDS